MSAPALLSRREVLRELMPDARSSTAHGLALFASDMGLYLAAMAGALCLPWLWAQILCSLVAGIKTANLLTLAHDAAHNSLVKSRRLNWWLGVFAFLPCWYSYRMWVLDHHVLHHANTNHDQKDTYTPYTKVEYDALPGWKRALERFYRRPNPVSFAVYYIIERWSQAKLYPHRDVPASMRKSAWQHFAFVAAVFAAWVATLVLVVPAHTHTGPVAALLLGLVLPFFTFMALASFVLWSMHTHPDVAWYRPGFSPDAETARAGELVSVHVRFPRWFSALMHDVTDHPVHHLIPAIPCYRLRVAQQRYNDLLGERAVVVDASWNYVSDTMRRCRLYDFEANRWLDWDGTPTTGLTKPYRYLPVSPAVATA